MALLSIRNLHASIGDKEILKGVNLEINVGEVHSIMGPNGNGKSTLAGVIAGNAKYTVTQGEVIYKGKNILDMPVDVRACDNYNWNGQTYTVSGIYVSDTMTAANGCDSIVTLVLPPNSPTAPSTKASAAVRKKRMKSSKWPCSTPPSPSSTKPTPASTSTPYASSPPASTNCAAPTTPPSSSPTTNASSTT